MFYKDKKVASEGSSFVPSKHVTSIYSFWENEAMSLMGA